MQQIQALFATLSAKQKAAVAVVLLLTGIGLAFFVRQQQDAGYRPLFDKLSAEDAGQLVQKLKEAGVPYRLGPDGTSVSVPADRVAELRLEMASAGLPRTGRIGFELFDRTNFGATDFGEQVNFRRAVEGELERSIVSLAEVDTARVHVTFPKNSVFLDSREEAKASVLLQLKPGMSLTPQNVVAVAHLVASAVEGLTPEKVSIVDGRGNLLSKQHRNAEEGAEPSEATLDYRKKLEAEFVRKINATLEPLLGGDRFRAGVSVDCDFSSGEQSEETFDPERSVMTSSQRVEETQQNATAPGGQPGTAANLPRTSGRAGSGTSNSSRRSESINYQTSRITRRVRLPQGTIRKVSASVLLDQTVTWEKQGSEMRKVITPPSPESLKTIRELVAAAIGFDEERGDQLTVDTLPFEQTMKASPPVKPAPAAPVTQTPETDGQDIWRKPIVWCAVGGATLLIAGGAAFFLRRKRARAKLAAAEALPEAEVAKALAGPSEEKPVLEDAERPASGLLPAPDTGASVEEAAAGLRKNVEENMEPYVKVLRTWLAEDSRV